MGDAGAAGGWNPPTFKGFPCQYCEKSFSSKKSLQNHTTSHMGLTLCVPCNRHFSTASNLKAHVNLMHPEMLGSTIFEIKLLASKPTWPTIFLFSDQSWGE